MCADVMGCRGLGLLIVRLGAEGWGEIFEWENRRE